MSEARAVIPAETIAGADAGRLPAHAPAQSDALGHRHADLRGFSAALSAKPDDT
jgi:hypothetical protein